MSTYFDETQNRISDGSVGKAADVNNLRDEVGVAFDKLPSETELGYVENVISPIQTQLDTLTANKAATSGTTYTGDHDFTGGTVTVASPTTSSNPATKLYADNLAFSAVLPSQTGNDGKYITTDGSTASWQSPYKLSVKSSNYTAVNGDSLLIDATSEDITITLPATPTAGVWVRMRVYVDGTTVTIGRNGANIESFAEDMQITSDISFDITYFDATRGWILA